MASRRRLLSVLVVAVPAALAIVLLAVTTPLFGDVDYDRTTVTVSDENGTTLGTVEVRIADPPRERYVGLSQTGELGPNEGMLIAYDAESRRTIVMRNMSFPLDIVFVDANRTITAIHHAPVPENTESDDLVHYSGRAKWVLELPAGWTRAHGVAPGDRVEIPERNG